MTDDEIVDLLRASAPHRSALELAQLLDELTGGGLSQGSLVTYFKRAFPRIPLRVLLDLGGWERIGGGTMTDAEFERLLAPWLTAED